MIKFFRKQKGATLVEYAILCAVVIAVAWVIKTPLQEGLSTAFSSVGSRITSAV